MAPQRLHGVLIDLLQTDSAIFLADEPSLREMAEYMNGLADLQATLDEVHDAVRRRFTGRLEEAATDAASRSRAATPRLPLADPEFGWAPVP